MYAAVEFDKKQCDVVPLSWLVDNQTNCYWLKAKNQGHLEKMVKSLAMPKNS